MKTYTPVVACVVILCAVWFCAGIAWSHRTPEPKPDTTLYSVTTRSIYLHDGATTTNAVWIARGFPEHDGNVYKFRTREGFLVETPSGLSIVEELGRK